jgi:CheY-like chemotaxis protein/AraC-like DNA-binding protein/signal transduction histidine kinase/ligand-binding sensor domain-containing protein
MSLSRYTSLISSLLKCLSFAILPTVTMASESMYVINKYSLPKEFNNSELFDMVSDEDGYIYLATAAGLMEWDGQSFKVYSSVNTSNFLSDRIQNLYLTSNNDLWLIRRNNHITLKKGELFETFVLPEYTNQLQMFLFDDRELPWVLMNGNVYRFNPEKREFESFNDLTGLERTYLIANHPSGTKIFLTDSGFWEYSSKGLSRILTNSLFPVASSTILSVHFREDKSMYVGHLNGYFSVNLREKKLITNHLRTNERVNRFISINENEFLAYSNFGTWNFSLNPSFSQFRAFSDQKNASIFKEINTKSLRDLTALIMTPNGGSVIISGGNRMMIDQQMKVDEIENPRFIYSDSENTFWIVTMNGSIYHLREKLVTNLLATPVGEIRNVYSIVEAIDGSMWYGCLINGIFREKNEDFTVWNYKNSSLPSNDIRYLYQNPADSTIYATVYHGGLWRFTNNDWEKVTEIDRLIPVTSSVIETMYHDPLKNRLLVGSSSAILVKDTIGWRQFNPYGMESITKIKVIRGSAQGNLFLGSAGNGITMLDSSDRHVWTITTEQGLNSNFVRDIFFQSADTLWIATENNGLNRLVLDSNLEVKEIKHIGLADGLSNTKIHRIISDDAGYLWINSNYGIMAANRSHLNAYLDDLIDFIPMFYIDENSGMLNPEGNGGVDNAGIKLRSGYIALPTQSGVIKIDPQKIYNSHGQGKPRAIIREIRSYDNIYYTNKTTSLKLPLGEREFSAFFQAPLFNHPTYRRVRYKLDGIDTDWRYLENNFEIWYTRINPGNYELKVEIIDPYGSQELTTLAVLIPSYIYERTWFQIFATVTMLVFIVFGTRYGYGKKLEMDKIRHLVDLQTKDLQKLNEEKSRFFASIIHEMKTPVAIIMNNIDLLFIKSHEFNLNNQTKPLNRLQRNSYKLLMLIETLSGIAKLQNKEIHFNKKEIFIVQATQLIIAEVEELFKEKNLKLRVITEPELENVTAFFDLEAWERIIVNLMNNIINYSPENGLIEMEIWKEKDLVIQISDERPNIETDGSDDFFDYLNEDVIGNSSTGSSFGLYLAKELLTKHEGTIVAQKNLKTARGLTFQIKIPFHNINNLETSNSDRMFKTSDEKISDTYTINDSSKLLRNYSRVDTYPSILFVEDNADYREYITSELNSDYKVTAVGSGSEALKVLEEKKPDLIISDVLMPSMSGFELVSCIREKEAFKTIPVIFLSALDSDFDIHTGLSAGADVYLTKGKKPQVLKLQIKALLRRENNITLADEQLTISNSKLVTDIKQLICRSLGNKNLNVDMISESLFISRATLYRKWSDENEISIQQYITQSRLNEAHELLKNENVSISDVALLTGFSDSGYFSTSFKKFFGYSPSKLNK